MTGRSSRHLTSKLRPTLGLRPAHALPALWLLACQAPQVGAPCPVRENATPAQRAADLSACFTTMAAQPVKTTLQNDVDILFVIDNSTSMSPKQNALAAAIPQFIQKIDATGANYHVAIASSDVGSLPMPGSTWGSQLGTACESYIGDDGKLKRLPCSLNQFYTDAGRKACNDLCPDPKFVPEGGKGYIAKVNGQTNVPRELKDGVDIGPQKAFQCMALIGDTGCGLEAPLESARRALDGHNPENEGFLRADSALAVIFITDEDDCSVQLARRGENDPTPMDCTPGDKNAAARCFQPDYRCIARSLACNESLDTPGLKNNCTEKADNYLEPIANYARFFSGLRPAGRLLVSGIWTPSIANGGKFNVVQKDAAKGVYGLNRDDGAGAACVAPGDPTIVGKPQLRLSKFASQFPGSLERSVCDIASYPAALDKIADAIDNIRRVACLPVTPTVTASGQALCLVGDVDARTPGNAPDVAFPQCGAGCCDSWASSANPTKDDPAIVAACKGEATDACFCVVPSKAGKCQNNDGTSGSVIGIWRKGGADGGADKVTSVRCAGH